MRRPLYTNHTTMDKKTCKSFLSMTWPRYAGAIRWVLLGLAVFALAYGLWRLFTEKSDAAMYVTAMLLIAAVALFLALWGWVLRIKRYTTAQQKSWGAPSSEKTVRFYDDCFEQENGHGVLRFDYGRVTSVKKTRDMLLLMIGPSSVLMRRDGFELEDDADFLMFLENRCRGAEK